MINAKSFGSQNLVKNLAVFYFILLFFRNSNGLRQAQLVILSIRIENFLLLISGMCLILTIFHNKNKL